MALIGISDPRRPARGWAPFALGFRPFFLLAGLAALLLIALWGWMYGGSHLLVNYYGFIGWHSHEMLFGYSSAVVTGFLLTAVRNWTGVQTLRGAPLAALAAVWLAGRLVPFLPLPAWLIAGVDLSFLPLFAIALATPLLRARHYKSLMFVAIIATLFAGNLLIHLQLLGLTGGGGRAGTYLAVYLTLLTVVIMGGRVIPFFTEKGLPPGFARREWRWVERLAPAGVVLAGVTDILWPGSPLFAACALLAAVANGWRLAGWYHRGIWRVPLLWVLQLGYAWLVAGFGLMALGAMGWFPPLQALHALTVGAIGGISLGMMARVTLGHTGRMLVPPPAMTWAFALLYLATAARVFLPLWLAPQPAIAVSAALWAGAFLLFVVLYAPMLLRARVDGQPG